MKRLGIIGATGLVGTSTLRVLLEENLLSEFEVILFASDRSAGRVLVFNEKHYPLIKLDDNFIDYKLDYAIFLTNEDVSEIWVMRFAMSGIMVIDNSSAFRLKDKVPLIVPEINIKNVDMSNGIIANPNCSTIQLVVVLDKLRKVSKISQVVVSSYQSVSGAGRDALVDLKKGTKKYFENGIRDNIIAQIGKLDSNGNSKEENKLINETKKILDCDFEISATAVRVPIPYCHGESVYIKFNDSIDLGKIYQALECDYIKVSKDLFYPSKCAGTNLTYVCRIRKVGDNSVQLFIIADNLRRGASYNAVKILEYLKKSSKNFVIC